MARALLGQFLNGFIIISRRLPLLTLLLFSSLSFGIITARAADAIYVIYDSSNSMWGELSDGSRKYETGRKALTTFLKGDFANRDLGLRIYGHRRAGDCRDSQFVSPFKPASEVKQTLIDAVNGVRPTGKTPIDYSLREALKDFGDRTGDILLISDGVETCDADPCALMQQWRDKNVGIKVHVVGFGIKDVERGQLSCIAELSGGTYFDANSALELESVLEQAREIAVAPDPEPVEAEPAVEGEGTPLDPNQTYGLHIVATDTTGQSLTVKGTIWREGASVSDASSGIRNVLEDGKGTYSIEVGAWLQDETIYNTVRLENIDISDFETTIDVIVPAPARVKAKFVEEGQPHRGAQVNAFQNDIAAFGFRRQDTALVRPGTYMFTSQPNQDNPMQLTAALAAGTETELLFDLSKTVDFNIQFELPNGDIIRRNSALWHDGALIYKVHAHNGGSAKPGIYELHADDRGAPLIPVLITIESIEDQLIIVPLPVGFLHVTYQDSPHYIKTPDRAAINAVDFKGNPAGKIDQDLPVTPGKYKIEGFTAAGYFDPIIANVELGKVTTVTLIPKPLGTIIVTYKPDANYKRKADRASIVSVETNQSQFARVGNEVRVLVGTYNIIGFAAVGDVAPQEITVGPGQTVTVELSLK